MASPSEQIISQLNDARNLALNDAAYYAQIVPGVLPIIGSSASLDLRRWGADFLAETFASPMLSSEDKQKLCVEIFSPSGGSQDAQQGAGGGGDGGGGIGAQVLQTLKEYLDAPNEDPTVVQSAVQTAASVYPLVFRHIINNPGDAPTWQKMAAIKSNLLRRMDPSPPGVRICCIKFVQRVVQTQTPGPIADPRRQSQNEISLALVPRDHPIIPPPHLEAEASGLLDRLLSILQEETSEAILVTATLNSLGSLVNTRPSISNRILSMVMNFNPLQLAGTIQLSSKTKVLIRSMERTTQSLLRNTLKKSPNHPLSQRMRGYLERLNQNRIELFDETSRKRPAPSEPTDGLDQTKRQRLGADVAPDAVRTPPPLAPGPVSFAQLFTLTDDEGSKNFDVQAIPHDLVVKILLPMLRSIGHEQMDGAIKAVRSRYLDLSRAATAAAVAPPTAPPEEEDDDYEPEYQPTEDTEQLLNRLDTASTPLEPTAPASAAQLAPIGPFELPPPPPLSPQEAAVQGQATVARILTVVTALEGMGPGTGAGPGAVGLRAQGTRGVTATVTGGFNRLAASANDRDAWVTVLARLATRAGSGLEDVVEPDSDDDNGSTGIASGTVKGESDTKGTLVRQGAATEDELPVANAIRQSLYRYVIEDFRRRIGVAIAWLCEEWYNDRIQSMSRMRPLSATSSTSSSANDNTTPTTPTYDFWMLKMLDGIVPYLDAKDGRTLLVFLSEVPALTLTALARVKDIARDPERVSLALSALHYLVLFRPPVRTACIDAMEDLWRNYDDARNPAAKLLAKWRPEVLKPPTPEESPQPDDELPDPPEEAKPGMNGAALPAGDMAMEDDDDDDDPPEPIPKAEAEEVPDPPSRSALTAEPLTAAE